MMIVSLFPRITEHKNPTNVEVISILKAIKSGKWREMVEGYRKNVQAFGKKSELAQAAKKAVPYFTASGTFTERSESGLVDHSGLIALDLDGLGPDASEVRDQVESLPFIFSAFVSVGGNGVCAIARIDGAEHARSFSLLESYFICELGLELDRATKDISRARFISYDPDLWINRDAVVFDIPKRQIRNNPDWVSQDRTPEEGVDMAVEWVERTGVRCEEGSLHNFRFQVACVCNRLGVSQSDLMSYSKPGYEKLSSTATNAVEWVYRNNKSEHGISSQYMKKRPHDQGYQAFYQRQNPADPTPEAVEAEPAEQIRGELKSRKLNPDKMPPEPEPFLSVYGGMICSKRNILVISGPSKSGKSAVGSAIIGGAMTSDRNAHTLGLTVAPNTSGKGIIYVDTEQSWFNFNRNGRNAVRRALLRDFPSYYHAYWLKGLVPKQKLQHTWEACRMHAEDHGGLHALFVDGIGDYVMSVNNEEVCGFVVDEFSRMSEEFDCPVITVLHKNPGSDKQRGWLGTILQMKAEAIISVDFNKKTATSTISYDFLRNAGFVPEIKFRWDDQARYHRFESYDERTKALADQFTSGDSGVLARIFTYCDQDEMPIESFKPFYEAATGRADGFQSFYDRCFEKGFISVNGSKIQLISI